MKPFHLAIQKIDESECYRILGNNSFCHLGVTYGNECYVVPMSYAFDGEFIYCHSREGKKLELLRTNPTCCVQVEEVKDFYHWKSVLAICSFDELTGEDMQRSARQLIMRLEHVHKVSELEEEFAAVLETSVVFRLRILKITGRFEEEVSHG